MMDELELLKKDWQNKGEHLPKLSYNEIYTMIWKKSSSIVKWILIISVLEIFLPQLLYLLPSMREGMNIYKESDVSIYFLGFSIIYYVGVVYFIYQFYRRYKEISVLDNAKNLMKKIIKTRRTVEYYVIFSLSAVFIMFLIFACFIYFNDAFLLSIEGIAERAKTDSFEKMRTAAMLTMVIGGIIFTAILGGVYFLLYGLLLKKLKRNYSQLRKLEI